MQADRHTILNDLNLNEKNNSEKRNSSTPRKSGKNIADPKYEFTDKFDLNEITEPVFPKNKKPGKTRSTTSIPNVNKFNLKRNTELISVNNLPIQGSQGNINVICRFRPLSSKETAGSKELCVEFIDHQNISIKVTNEKHPVKFSFDRIFDMSSTQQQVFEFTALPIVESVMEGFNGTIFAYGQTSSGKTHTMQGVIDDQQLAGITPRIIDYVFSQISSERNSSTEYKVKISMIEVYMEKINDLLDTSNSNLQIREDKVKSTYVDKLSENYVSSMEEVLELIRIGTTNRVIASTNMNQESSRGHLIFLMTINQFNTQTFVSKTGKLYLVDLAGSEKISKTGATGHILDEAKLINKSLTSLGMVINTLAEGKGAHVPYRDSKLTRILQESIGGNSKTRLIIACSPSNFNDSETLSTCRFGSRAKNIKNTPKINKETTVAELKIEIEKLEKKVSSTNLRIEQLEGFIRSKNMEIPFEGDFSLFKQIQKKILTDNIEGKDSKDEEKKYSILLNGKTSSPTEIISIEEEKIFLNRKYEELLLKLNSANSEGNNKFIEDIESLKTKHLKVLDQFSKSKENSNKKINSQKLETFKKYSERRFLYENEKSSKNVPPYGMENCEIPLDIIENLKSLFENSDRNLNPQSKMMEYVNCMYSIEKSLNLSYSDDERISSFKNLEIEPNNQMSILKDRKSIIRKREIDEFDEKNYKAIIKSMEEKFSDLVEKSIQLEAENKELRNNIIPWLENPNSGEKEYVEKSLEMQKKILQLNTIYHQLISQKSVMKIESNIIEKKLTKRDERIRTLNEENSELRELNKMKDEKLSIIQKTLIKNSDPPNVVKVIRGGRGKSFHSNLMNQISQSMLSPH